MLSAPSLSTKLEQPHGNFYGTTVYGGTGWGTAFKMTPAGVLTTLVEFNNFAAPKGRNPYGSLVQGLDGRFYGMTQQGGASNYGTVFKLDAGLPPLNTAPTNIALSASSVPENQPVGTTIGYFTAQDPNSGDTATFTLVAGTGSDDNAAFTISNGTNFVTATAFDYESKSSYSIRVRATDSGGLTFEKQLTISVTNVNEALTNLTLNFSTTTESQPIGALVGAFTAQDPDAGDTATFTLVPGAGGDDNASFTISDGTNLATAAVFDYESKSSYTIRVRATDSGGLFIEQAFTITVTDVPEWQPLRLALPEARAGGGLGLSFSNAAGGPIYSNESGLYAVEMSTNLALTNWQALTNGLSLTNGVLQLDDADATNSPARFYRVIRK